MKLRVTRKQIALCLVAGVVTTVLLAWSGAIAVGLNGPGGVMTTAVPSLCHWSIAWAWEHRDIELFHGSPEWSQADDPGWAWDQLKDEEFPGRWLPSQPPFVLHTKTWYFTLAGWPMKALIGRTKIEHIRDDAQDSITYDSQGLFGVSLPGGTPTDRRGASLPYYISWPGFLVDTALYSFAWWSPLAGLSWARTARRARRGLCTRCAYDLRGIASGVCPECGQARPT